MPDNRYYQTFFRIFAILKKCDEENYNSGYILETKWKAKAIEIAQVEAGQFRSLQITEENNLLNCKQQDLVQKNTIQQIWYASKIEQIKMVFMDRQTYELAEFKPARSGS